MILHPPKRRKLFEDAQDSTWRNLPSDSTLARNDFVRKTVSIEDNISSVDSANSELDISIAGGRYESESNEQQHEELTTLNLDRESTRGLLEKQQNTASKPNGSFHANTRSFESPRTFSSKVEDLLFDSRPKHGENGVAAEELARELKSVIESIPDREPSPIIQAEKLLLKTHAILVPFPSPRPPSDARYNLAFAKPSTINVVGSYAMKTGVKTDGRNSIDMVVFMPPALFSEKDYLDYRYFYKRSYYLACLAAGIQQRHDLNLELSFRAHNGNSLVPVLVIQPDPDIRSIRLAKSNWEIIIMPALNVEIFQVSKTFPNRSCIRPKKTALDEEVTPSTPFYNATIRSDCSVISYLKLIHSTIAEIASYRDACVLGRIWLKQRGLGSSIGEGGFGSFEWNALLALLLQGGGQNGKPLISDAYDSQQLFRAMVQFIATRDLRRKPLMWETPVEAFQPKAFDSPVVFDGVRGMNILYKMNVSSYKVLQQEARNTAISFNRSNLDPFFAVFLAKTSEPLMKYDLNVLMKGVHYQWSSEKLYKLLCQGLNDRVDIVTVKECQKDSWHITESGIDKDETREVMVGLILNQENAGRSVDRGPSAEDKAAAAAFRDFWGQKAELRRFKDGAILESLIWTKSESATATVKEIITYLLVNRLGQDTAAGARFVGHDFEKQISAAHCLHQGLDPVTTVPNAYNALEKEIRALEGLPLHIRQLFLAGQPSLSSRCRAEDFRADVVLIFEGSPKWPDNLEAIQVTKIAFLLRLSSLIQESNQNIITQIGLENEQRATFNKSFLDIDHPSGAKFRIRINHDREIDLIERCLKDENLTPYERMETASSLAEYKRVFLRLPLHTQAMQSLSTRFPVFASTVRILKAWFNAHFLGPHFSEQLIEIMVARTFLHPSPWSSPSSAVTGFFRTLYFLSKWNWRDEPLYVDYSGTMKSTEANVIYTRFAAWRKIDPFLNRVALFVATNHDPEGTIWTETHPSKVLSARMSSLARSACQYAQGSGLTADFASLFRSPLDDYDFILHLKSAYTTRYQRKHSNTRKSQFKNLTTDLVQNGDSSPLDAVNAYLQELQKTYADSIIFFYDQSGGEIISGIWNPYTDRRRWKVHLTFSSTCLIPVDEQDGMDGADAIINKDAMLAEIVRIGGDMVSRMQVNR